MFFRLVAMQQAFFLALFYGQNLFTYKFRTKVPILFNIMSALFRMFGYLNDTAQQWEPNRTCRLIVNSSVFIHLFFFFMQTGVVKFFNESKGYGFITVDGSGEEIFVHQSGLQDRIRENDKVSFETQQGKKGVNAVNVRIE